jgi:hypothetical protein
MAKFLYIFVFCLIGLNIIPAKSLKSVFGKKRNSELETINIHCTTSTAKYACSNHGECLPDNTCVCEDEYASFECDNDTECCYKRKSQLIAFLLSLFLGIIGLGRWYTEMYIAAATQFLLLILFVPIAVSSCAYDIKRVVFATLIVLLMLIFIVIFANGKIPDGNGVLMNPL